MSVIDRVSENGGTVSSALSKALAHDVLEGGRVDILLECIDLASHEAASPSSRHIRSGAAKVVEIVAEERPELVAPHLEQLFPALSVKEPQTRWIIIRVMGFCARLNKPKALEAVVFAETYLADKEGLCIASSADLFLGDLGALSKQDAHRVFPILRQSMESPLTNEQDWLLEALAKVLPNLDPPERDRAVEFAEGWRDSPRKTTQKRALTILELR
jgi:hypothetical protein